MHKIKKQIDDERDKEKKWFKFMFDKNSKQKEEKNKNIEEKPKEEVKVENKEESKVSSQLKEI